MVFALILWINNWRQHILFKPFSHENSWRNRKKKMHAINRYLNRENARMPIESKRREVRKGTFPRSAAARGGASPALRNQVVKVTESSHAHVTQGGWRLQQHFISGPRGSRFLGWFFPPPLATDPRSLICGIKEGGGVDEAGWSISG